MLALTESGFISLATALIAGSTTVLVAFLAHANQRDQKEAREHRKQATTERAELAEAVRPTNGHDTLGQGIAELEMLARSTQEQVTINTRVIKQISDRLREGEERFGRIEEKQSEMLAQHGEARGTIRQVAETLERLRAGFERDDPLRRRAVEEWGPDGKQYPKKRK